MDSFSNFHFCLRAFSMWCVSSYSLSSSQGHTQENAASLLIEYCVMADGGSGMSPAVFFKVVYSALFSFSYICYPWDGSKHPSLIAVHLPVGHISQAALHPLYCLSATKTPLLLTSSTLSGTFEYLLIVLFGLMTRLVWRTTCLSSDLET